MKLMLDGPMWIEFLIYVLLILFSIVSIWIIGLWCWLTMGMKEPFPVLIGRSCRRSEVGASSSSDAVSARTVRRIHLAISTEDVDRTVEDYTRRLGFDPCVVVPGEYALWRSDTVNLSVRHDTTVAAGSLRHLGWEDSAATEFSTDRDVNGIVWEYFSAAHQADEIKDAWPGTGYAASET